MADSRKLRVAVIYGGRSGEHEVALQSAASVIRHLDTERFEIIPVAVDKQGRWHLNSLQLIRKSQGAIKSLPVLVDPSVASEVVLPANPLSAATGLIPVGGNSETGRQAVDVVFPVMHGPLCEDGSIQGLLELADLPYVGCGVLASAVAMDKDLAKRIARDAGLPIVPFVSLKSASWRRDPDGVREHIAKELGFPVFVKPANLGSSVGVHKVKDVSALEKAMDDAFSYDSKVLIERAVDAREIEVAVLESPREGEPPLVSVVGEIAPTHEFYSYEAKYLDENGARLIIPAPLSPEQIHSIQNLAKDIFVALECEGMARVDLFLDRKSGALYFNEVNTIPGFTQISMYPKLWEASGVPYRELLSKLIDLAMARHDRRRRLKREYSAS